ncbi:MAG: NAD(P)/FAD-dependent oxidoreductase [Bradyrhizobium sp.]|nr:NAD(P)/FAD-dependent oxidoreductase [Bradyrhizobium sp.]
MDRRKFLIVGGGLAARAAVQSIRETGEAGSILVALDEADPPYNRPPLSKGLGRGQAVDTVWLPIDAASAELRLGTRIVALDPIGKTATSAAGEVFGYDKLLLATGGSPRRLNDSDASVIYFRRLADFRHVRDLASRRAEFAIIGGGFIGSEMAASLAMNDCKVSLFFSGPCIGDRLFPRPLANFLNLYFRKHGVDVRFCERVRGVERRGNKLMVHAGSDAGGLAVDAVIAGIGIDPNVALAKRAGLSVSDGIVVDKLLRTNAPDIFAAGDVANFPCAALQQRIRIEHEDNAALMGRTAGLNMTGRSEPYCHLPYFYSVLFDLGYEAVGEVDRRLDIVEDWDEKFRKGTIFYLRHNCVRGVLLWNIFGMMDTARELISSRHQLPVRDLMAQLRQAR